MGFNSAFKGLNMEVRHGYLVPKMGETFIGRAHGAYEATEWHCKM